MKIIKSKQLLGEILAEDAVLGKNYHAGRIGRKNTDIFSQIDLSTTMLRRD